jgi:hypothetical protein
MQIIKPIPGRRFKVLASTTDKTLLKASIGFIGYPNFLFRRNDDGSIAPGWLENVLVYVTRRGKKGKSRFENYNVTVPIIFDPRWAIPDEQGVTIMSKIGTPTWTNLFVGHENENVMQLDNLDFLAWGCSILDYLQNIKRSDMNIAFNIVGSKKRDPLNKFQNVRHSFEGGSNLERLELFDSQDFRLDFMNELRLKEQLLRESIIAHRKVWDTLVNDSIDNLVKAFFRVGMDRSRYPAELGAIKHVINRDGEEKGLKLMT